MANRVGFSGENWKKWEKEQIEQPESSNILGFLPQEAGRGRDMRKNKGGE